MMRKILPGRILPGVVLAAAIGLGACENKLTVANPNSGNTERVLGTPADAENLLGSYYKRYMTGVYGSTTNLEGMANIFALMNYSSLANNCMNSHAPFVGASNVNSPGNTCNGEQFRLYQIEGEVTRVASTVLAKMDSGLTLGLTDPKTDARNLRARAFAEFLRGISLGYVALMHDSAAIISPTMGTGDDCKPDPFTGVCVGKLRPYTEVADSAYAALQRSLDYATTTGTTGTDGFPLPGDWIPSTKSYSQAEFVKLVHSYRARLRANMARTPTERAAADWTAIIADVDAGITFDDSITTSTTTFNVLAWRNQYGTRGSWHQMPPFYIGMADGGTSYAAWIAQPLGDRGAGNNGFFMVSPDLRFPQGATRSAQQSDFTTTSCTVAASRCKRYFLNRNGGDNFSGAGWGFSNYDFLRFESWRTRGDAGSARNGSTPIMMLSEMRLLKAEGLYRKGDYAGAAALVNVSRTATVDANGRAIGGGLPAITAFDATTPVPGGAACVPKVPQAP
ncbi:MAG TPA: hypothetical protein VHH11_04570, partial [Gammaproteobacteria bacterium]|nr:hypothetical protein [Gammaproteobacteria bacterium]